MATLTGIFGVRNGLDVDNLEATTDEEIDAFLDRVRKGRGPLDPGPQYEMRANSMWLYTRPDFAKLHMRTLDGWHSLGLEPIITASSFANLHTYINQAWESRRGELHPRLATAGCDEAQLMEGIMHAQMSAGCAGWVRVSGAPASFWATTSSGRSQRCGLRAGRQTWPPSVASMTPPRS
jgi:hypothetical protein